METSSGSPSMPSKETRTPYGFYLVLVVIIAVVLALPFHTPVKNWLREKFRKCVSCISSCLRICECGSEEANESGADDQVQIELNDLINELNFPPQQNRDNPGPRRDPRQPELLMGMREMQNNIINLHPEGDICGEHRINGLPEILVEVKNLRNLENPMNGDQEHSL